MPQNSASALWADLKALTQSLLYEKSKTCLLCATPTPEYNEFCSQCQQSYFHPELGRCRQCGKLIVQDRIECMDCAEGRGPKGLNQVVAWGHYTGAWREFIQSVKFKSQPYRLKRIAQPFSDWAIRELPPPNLLVPVPMHFERLAERGFNQSAGIASLLHWELGIPFIEVLERVCFTVPQVGLNRSERLHNLEGAFRITSLEYERIIQGARIWLIDDVTTTGATLEACATELKKGGASEVFGLTLAAGLQNSTIQYNQTMV
jgi:competence protein ComFC